MRETSGGRMAGATALAALIGWALAGCAALDERPNRAAMHYHARHPAHARHSTRAARIVRPHRIEAGARLRQFCDQRHVDFQAGKLDETAAARARNNELCKTVYAAEPAAIPEALAGRAGPPQSISPATIPAAASAVTVPVQPTPTGTNDTIPAALDAGAARH